jgi:plasmid stability protein
MSDLLIRNIDPSLRQQIEQRAQSHGRSLSDEAKFLIRSSLAAIADGQSGDRGLGTAMLELVRPEDRGDDLVFEHRGGGSESADFG